MKHIVKGVEPSSFQSWKKKNPRGNWDDFSGTEIYQELRQYLIDEQAMLCCYCEIALKENTDAHIEHFKPKSKYPVERFNYNNLFASCRYNDSCGSQKLSEYFTGLISPLDKNCQLRFTYTGNGKIIPFDENDQSAQKTIEVLALNCKRLKDRRLSVIKALDNDWITIDHLKKSLDNCVDWYNGFFTVIQYVTDKRRA
jgi:uncharacterized protein (TIGR02646 family)